MNAVLFPSNTRCRPEPAKMLPEVPRGAAADGVAFAGTDLGAWFATTENGGNTFATKRMQAVGGLAAVSDHAVLRLTGPKVREALAKGSPIETAFRPGDVASTVVSHIGVVLWCIEDDADGPHLFETAIFRCLADSFRHWLLESVTEFGLVVINRAD